MKSYGNPQAFFALLQAGLWETETRLMPYDKINYSKVLKLAQEQSVIGLVAAGLEHVVDVQVPKVVKLTFVGYAMQIEQQNLAMDTFVAELFKYLQHENIKAVLVKGQGVAQCFERPLWRASGDVDLLLDDESYERAKVLLSPLATSVEQEYTTFKHLGLMMSNGIEVELHGTLHTRLSSRIDRYLDAIQEEAFKNNRIREWNSNGIEVPLPNPNDDVIFLFTHILHHFYIEGIGLRQICDWCRFLWTYKDEIDSALLEIRLKDMGLMSEWKAFASLAVNWLGMPMYAMPLFIENENHWKKKGDRIMALVMESGNFGHNRESSRGKIHSAWRKMNDFGKRTKLFPMDSPKFFCHFVKDGLQLATSK